MKHTRDSLKHLGVVDGTQRRRNLLNSQGTGVRQGTLGKRDNCKALTDCKVIHADGTVTIIPRVKPRTHKTRVTVPTTAQMGTVLDTVVSLGRPPKHSLSALINYMDSKGYTDERIKGILNIYRARPDYGTTVEVVTTDTWARH